MKEVKAYIRCQKAETVISALEEAGIYGITLIDTGMRRSFQKETFKQDIPVYL